MSGGGKNTRAPLAAERTYAAWVRTGLVAMASGIGAKALLIDLFPDAPRIHPAILVFINSILGIVSMAWRVSQVARNRIFTARDRGLNSAYPAGQRPIAKITRRIGRANAGFSRKVSVTRDPGNCVVGPGGLEPPTRPL